MTISDKVIEAAAKRIAHAVKMQFGCDDETADEFAAPLARAALAAAEQAMWEPKKCRWQYDDHDEAWATSCGHMYTIIDGTPADNGMEFCCYCGGSLPPPPETKK